MKTDCKTKCEDLFKTSLNCSLACSKRQHDNKEKTNPSNSVVQLVGVTKETNIWTHVQPDFYPITLNLRIPLQLSYNLLSSKKKSIHKRPDGKSFSTQSFNFYISDFGRKKRRSYYQRRNNTSWRPYLSTAQPLPSIPFFNTWATCQTSYWFYLSKFDRGPGSL